MLNQDIHPSVRHGTKPSKFRIEHQFDLAAIIAPQGLEIKDNILTLVTPNDSKLLMNTTLISLSGQPSHLITCCSLQTMKFKRFFSLLPLAGLAMAGHARCAHAEFRVCNQTLNLYNVAIGIEKPDIQVGIHKSRAFYTEGWWTLPANACVQLVKDDLTSRYVYLYAVNIYGDDSLSGSRKLCVGSKKFVIEHPPGELWNCWVRGYQEAGFKEIDTGGTARSWTVFIRENQN